MSRRSSIDLLRVVAVLAVILQHVTAVALREASTPGLQFVNLITRFNVPTLLIISGYLSATSTRSLPERIKRLLIPYAAWIVIYTAFRAFPSGRLRLPEPLSLLDGGSFYFLLWFLPMLIYITLIAALARTQRQRVVLLGALLCLWAAVVGVTLNMPLFPYWGSLRGFLAILPAFASMYVAAQWLGHHHQFPRPIVSGAVALGLIVALGVPGVLPSGPGMIGLSARMLLASLAGFALLATAVGSDRAPSLGPIVEKLGRGSLGLYMGHMIVLRIVLHFVPTVGRLWWATGITLLTALGTAILVLVLSRFALGRLVVS